jgi:putative membrane protein
MGVSNMGEMDVKKEMNINEPQRQSALGLIILFLDTFKDLLKQTWIFLIVFILRINEETLPAYLLGTGILIVVIAISAWLIYTRFTFYFDAEKNEFVVNKGVFSRVRIAIHVDKIQQVNINQSFVQGLLNIYSLDIDTAGTSSKEIQIRAINFGIAKHLKENILEFKSRSTGESGLNQSDQLDKDSANNEVLFHKLSTSMLFKIGITTKYGRTLAIIIGFIATLVGNKESVVETFELNEAEIESTIVRGFALVSVGSILMLVVLLVLTINLVTTFLRHYDYKMLLRKYSIFISSGLIAKKTTLIRPGKIQITTSSQNFFQRKLGFLDFKIRQASPSDGSAQNISSLVEIPGCDLKNRDSLLSVLFQKPVHFDNEISPNYRYLNKAFFTGIVIPLMGFLLFSHYQLGDIWAFWYVSVIYVAFSIILIYFNFKNSRLKLSLDYIGVQSGAWDVRLKIIEPYKLQGITIKQLFWHKRVNIAHIIFHTAAGDITFRYAPYDLICQATRYWLHHIESTNKDWM